jgi:beta-galactosidase
MEQWQPDGALLARRLSGICRAEDPSRPVTAGFNGYPGAVKNKLADEVDVVGFNYRPGFYEEILREHPHWVVYGSETASTVSSRGVYHLPFEKYDRHDSLQVTSYDIVGPEWAYPPDIEWRFLEENPRMLGEFIWTGFDYLGEPTPYGGRDNSTDGYWNDDWPAHGSYFGAVDLAGFPKDRFYLYQSQWTDKPMVHLLPHWNWEGREGQSIPVMAYTTGEEVELFLNGESLGRRRKGVDLVELPVDYWNAPEQVFASPYRLKWDVPYAPGTLAAVAYREGKAIARKEVRTADQPARLILTPDRATIHADGGDLSFVTVRVEDEKGNLCPLAANEVRFTVDGVGKIAALGSGDPTSTEPFQSDRRKAFNGLCLLIVRSTGEEGPIAIKAESDSLVAGTLRLLAQ